MCVWRLHKLSSECEGMHVQNTAHCCKIMDTKGQIQQMLAGFVHKMWCSTSFKGVAVALLYKLLLKLKSTLEYYVVQCHTQLVHMAKALQSVCVGGCVCVIWPSHDRTVKHCYTFSSIDRFTFWPLVKIHWRAVNFENSVACGTKTWKKN